MNKWTKRLLLVFEIGGGFLGLTAVAQGLFSSGITPVAAFFNVIFSGLFLLGIVAGLALVENPALGLRLSSIYQAIQVPMFTSPVVTYILTSGFMVGVNFHVVEGDFRLGANFNFGSQYQFYLFHGVPLYVGINIVAVALLVAVRRAMRELDEAADEGLSFEGAPGVSPDEVHPDLSPVEDEEI